MIVPVKPGAQKVMEAFFRQIQRDEMEVVEYRLGHY
jgi:hypothetical protein